MTCRWTRSAIRSTFAAASDARLSTMITKSPSAPPRVAPVLRSPRVRSVDFTSTPVDPWITRPHTPPQRVADCGGAYAPVRALFDEFCHILWVEKGEHASTPKARVPAVRLGPRSALWTVARSGSGRCSPSWRSGGFGGEKWWRCWTWEMVRLISACVRSWAKHRHQGEKG